LKRFLGLGSYKRKYMPRFAQYKKTLPKCITNDKVVTMTKRVRRLSRKLKRHSLTAISCLCLRRKQTLLSFVMDQENV
jgi:hypothetical protein